MKPLAITDARIIDPARGIDAIADILVADRMIAAIGRPEIPSDAMRIDAAGLVPRMAWQIVGRRQALAKVVQENGKAYGQGVAVQC